MPVHLLEEEVVTIRVLAEKGQKKSEIAKALNVTEGTVRYHLRREAKGEVDGRRLKSRKVDPYSEVIKEWASDREGSGRPINVRELYEDLILEYGYTGSYKSVLRYIRHNFSKPKIRTYRRVETPPGAQSQTDWGEFKDIDIGLGPQSLHAFVMTLSHSRKPAVIWSRSENQLSWLSCHNEAYRRFQGIAAVNRIDNLKTGIAQGAGAWGKTNKVYRAYAKAVGFHIDACAPRRAYEKGKVEAKVRLARLRANPEGQVFDSLEHLQSWTDERLDMWSRKAVCPITGLSIYESWQQELGHLAPLPILPEPFDIALTRPVYPDCMVYFENHSYPVPFIHAGKEVEVRGCAGKVQILADGRVIKEHPRGTLERLIYDPSCYEGDGDARVIAPPPLGSMGSRLQEIMDMAVEQRPVDLYAALAEVAR